MNDTYLHNDSAAQQTTNDNPAATLYSIPLDDNPPDQPSSEVAADTQATENAAAELQEMTHQVQGTNKKEQRKELLRKRKELEKELETTVSDPPPHPNIVSRLFFAWVLPLIRLGRKYVLLHTTSTQRIRTYHASSRISI